MSLTIDFSRLLIAMTTFVVLLVGVFAITQSASALTPPLPKSETPQIFVKGMKAIVVFTATKSCPEYIARWGDGIRTVGKAKEVCAQVVTTKRVSHTYAKPGRYKVIFVHNGKETVRTISVRTDTNTTSFGLMDVRSVVAKFVDPDQARADEEYTNYSIVLKSGKTVTVKVPAMLPINEAGKLFKNAGYTGDVAALMRFAETSSVTPPLGFAITDVRSVTLKIVNPNEAAVDAAYQLYIITLKSGKVIEVKNYGNGTVEMNNKAFKDAGYKGDVAALIQFTRTSTPIPVSTGVVRGASITDISAALDEVLSKAQKLQAAVASL